MSAADWLNTSYIHRTTIFPKHFSFLTCTKTGLNHIILLLDQSKFCVLFLFTQCHDNIVLKWRLWHTVGNTSFWCEMTKVKRAKGFGRFPALEVSGGMVWLGDTLVDKSTLWISGIKNNTEFLVQLLNICTHVSTYAKFRTQTSLSLNLSTNSNSANSSASSGTQDVCYPMSSGRSCSAFPHF